MASTSDVTATSTTPTFKVNTPVLIGSAMITTDKLNGKNYSLWAASMELWCKDQGASDHLTSSIDHIPIASQDQWERVDAQILGFIWQTIDFVLLSIFRPIHTYYGTWVRARKLYSSNFTHLYNVIGSLFHLRQEDSDMQFYLGRHQSLVTKLHEILPFSSDIRVQQVQWDRLITVLCLHGIRPELGVRT